MKRRFSTWWTVGLLLVAVGCAGGGADGAGEAVEAPGPDRAVTGLAGGGDGDGGGGRDADALPQLQPVSTTDKIIKEGRVALEVPADGFDSAFQRVVDAAEALGGSLVASSTTNSEERGPSGSVTLRVPVDQYEQLLLGVRDFGNVRETDIRSKDVTTEYVDLEARLRQQQAQERFYLGLLDEAEDIDDAIAIQQQLEGVQTEIERIQGRLQFLDARTAFSTLVVDIFEPGGAPLILADAAGEPSLAHYWATARHGFLVVVGAMIVTGTSLLPLLLPVALAVLLWRGLRRRPLAAGAPTE